MDVVHRGDRFPMLKARGAVLQAAMQNEEKSDFKPK